MRWLLLTVLAACSVETVEVVDATPVVPPELPMDVAPPDDACARLPSSGACALACDLEQLIETYVPAGTCMSFACELVGGGTLHLHACG